MERTALALMAGVAVAAMAYLVLGAGARDELRLRRALGLAEVLRPRRTISAAAALALLGRLMPASPFDALGGVIAATGLSDAERERWQRLARAVGVVLVAVLVLLAFGSALWLFGLFGVPRVSRWLVERELAARERARRRELDREVTGALDVFVLALEAGLPFERALSAYADTVPSVLSDELRATIRELEVGYRRREALDRAVARTGSASLGAVASSVRVAEQFGTPLAAALRTLVIDLRARRRQRLQEAALRAPVTMLLPTAAFILLPIFAIVLGPIALRVATGTLF